ncbi:MAG: c-type cytochrome [Halieaceae bacterium]|jgi:mono/diheme cytochrome c family protein|nr:c-type cytochrome [Halieaceae bacterium]
MQRLWNIRAVLCFMALLLAGVASASDVPSKPMPEETDALREEGRQIYIKRCSFCHGLMGDGNGPAADYMDPRPRDFTLGTFKFRTTQSGELPTNGDLYRTVSRGLSGTGMQAFDSDLIKNGLTEDQRWAVIAYIKTFAFEFDDPELDPVKTGMVIELPATRAPYNDETIAKGKAVFERAKCWECHGKQGRGDGQKAFDREDDWGYPIRIRNVTHPWKIKSGTAVEDIYMRFSSGILGTPMPSFVDALTEEERWHLANFIKSLQHERTKTEVLMALPVEGDLPDDPLDERWMLAQPTDFRLTGQVVGAPRWQNPSIEMVTVKAMFNGDELVFQLVWDDAFKDATHDESQELDFQEISQVGAYNSYVPAFGDLPRQLETFRDSIALQFPVKEVVGTKKPHFFRGSSSGAVNLWVWKSDAAEQGERAVDEMVARGWKQNPKLQAEEEHQVESGAVWDKGRWHVLMKRSLITEDSNDVQFKQGKFIPISLNAWDGSNGEHGLVMSLSTWYYLVMEAPTPISAYVFALLAAIVTGWLGLLLVKKASNQ